MKPLTAQSWEGRVLVALRAVPLANSAILERFGSVSALPNLIKAGYVARADGYEGSEYRITEAGRAACPYRNPLAAPGAVRPITQEGHMSPKLKRQDVLDAILDAGSNGITKTALIKAFDRFVNDYSSLENAITSHLVMLKRDELIESPARGIWKGKASELDGKPNAVAASHAPALPETVFDKPAPYKTAMEKRLEQTAPAVETITATTPGDRRGPVVFEDIDSEFALFSSGRIEISDGRNTVVIRGAALAKLSDFLQVLS